MNTEEYLPEAMRLELLKRYVNIYDRDGNFRGVFDIVQDIATIWEDAISAPNLTKSVFDSDDCDIDDYIELATDEDFKVLFGVD